jgi:hypothetical protein
MTNVFLKHQWLQFRRSSAFERELSLTIFTWALGILVFFSFASLAYALPKIVDKIPEVDDLLQFINLVLVYYFLSELLVRYFLQKVPALDIQPYLNLPIKRKNVAWFLTGKSLISPFNVLSILLTLPFTVEIVIPKVGA